MKNQKGDLGGQGRSRLGHLLDCRARAGAFEVSARHAAQRTVHRSAKLVGVHKQQHHGIAGLCCGMREDTPQDQVHEGRGNTEL